jgi:hypothetical protein
MIVGRQHSTPVYSRLSEQQAYRPAVWENGRQRGQQVGGTAGWQASSVSGHQACKPAVWQTGRVAHRQASRLAFRPAGRQNVRTEGWQAGRTSLAGQQAVGQAWQECSKAGKQARRLAGQLAVWRSDWQSSRLADQPAYRQEGWRASRPLGCQASKPA